MNLANRVYYKKSDGSVIFQTGEMSDASNERPDVDEIDFLDIPFGAIDYTNTLVIAVEDGKPTLKTFNIDTPENQRIRELEDELLLQVDTENGGIL